MAIVIALQAMLTAIGVKETRKQAELMNESLVEMRKQRLNIEEFKNSVITYLEDLIKVLAGMPDSYKEIKDPYSYLRDKYRARVGPNLSPAESGLIWRISRFIERFLEIHGFSLQELEELKKLGYRFNDYRTRGHEKPELARKIQEKSQELLKIAKSILMRWRE